MPAFLENKTVGVFVQPAVNGFLFGVGLILAAFVMKALLHIGLC